MNGTNYQRTQLIGQTEAKSANRPAKPLSAFRKARLAIGISILATCPFLASGAHQTLILPTGDEIALSQGESRSVIQKADIIEDIIEIIKEIIDPDGDDDRDDGGEGETNP